MFKGVSCTSNECLNKAIHWTSIKHVQCIKIYGYLVDIFYERIAKSVFNTVYSVRFLSCLRVKGSFSRSCPNNISINSHKKHGGWNKKMAETGQEEGYVLDLKWMSIIHTYFVLLSTKLDIHYM
ncbi:hypothetical protein NQ317_011835 [Molorchus minor]|uniref:Uncharacterized protein n=1 Tax=Molorchus minor TaxID=1323400 RepID=A0ABQ9IZN6_9CUCU|nr:hypothetical protein NQ317_011835 [Molorchus minor]